MQFCGYSSIATLGTTPTQRLEFRSQPSTSHNGSHSSGGQASAAGQQVAQRRAGNERSACSTMQCMLSQITKENIQNPSSFDQVGFKCSR